MRGGLAALIFFATAILPANGGAMTMGGEVPATGCRIVSTGKAASAVDGTAICAEVERAIAAAAPNARYTAEIKLLSASRLAAILVVNGRTLPEQNFAVMDRQLDRASIGRFAESLAAAVAKAIRP
jgi:hypothetical protein